MQLKSKKGTWNHKAALDKALDERTKFLKENPKYADYQEEIDRILDKVNGSEQRMIVLAMLMEGKLSELTKQFKKLEIILDQAKGA